MHRFVVFLCCALLFGLVAGSGPAVHLESEVAKKNPASATGHALRTRAKKTSLPMLELLSLGLDTWGLKGHNNTQKPPPDEGLAVSGDGQVSRQPFNQFMSAGRRYDNPLARAPEQMNMFDARASQPTIQPLNFNLYSREVTNNLTNTATIAVLGLVVFIFVACFWMPWACGDASEVDEKVAHPSKDNKAKLNEGSLSQSSWARAYLEAEGEQKEALELLFRCNIISTEELACSVISQEHIQECTWIATHMLQHRPLEEWVALWQQAQQTFQDSVAECFEQRPGEGQAGFTASALAQRLKSSRDQYASPSSPAQTTSMPSSANLDFVSADTSCDFRPLQS